MSGFWVNFYLKADTTIENLWENVVRLAQQHIPAKIQQPQVFTSSETAKTVNDTVFRPNLLLYPLHKELYSLDLRGFFCAADVIDKDPAWGNDPDAMPEDTHWPYWDNFATDLSRILAADLAWVTFLRNPALETTIILFYQSGQNVGQYYCTEGDEDFLFQPKDPAAIENIFDGRFAFVNAPQIPYQEDGMDRFYTHFKANHIHTQGGETKVYRPSQHRLFLPFIEPGIPYGMIQFDDITI